MLQNAYFLAKIGVDIAENERNFARNWQLPYGLWARYQPAPRKTSALGSTSRSAPTSPAASWLCVSCPFSRNYRSTTAIVSKKTSSENVLTIQFHCTREIYRAVLHNRPCSDSAGRCMPGARSRCQTQGGLVVIADRLTFRTRLLISQGP